jgi:hypothetical protein
MFPLAMECGMFGWADQFQVFDPIVALVPVDVVDPFEATEPAAQFLFHQPAVFVPSAERSCSAGLTSGGFAVAGSLVGVRHDMAASTKVLAQ